MYNHVIHPYSPPLGIFVLFYFFPWWQGTITLNFYLLGVAVRMVHFSRRALVEWAVQNHIHKFIVIYLSAITNGR